jgi:hypothetical protein
MADTNTPNLNLTKPEVGASEDTWGTKINANLDTLDTQVFGRLSKASNLSDVASASTSRTNLGLGTAATTDSTDYVNVTALTGQANMPAGTTAQRTSTPVAGALRFNSTDTSFEGYDGTEWGAIGGGGGASEGIFYENDQALAVSYTVLASKNAMTAGPITINSGVTVTVETGARWVVL